MAEGNGTPPAATPNEFKPDVMIRWDDATQTIQVAGSPRIKNLEFGLMLLLGATEQMRFQIELARAANMQRQAMEAHQAQAIADQIHKHGGRR